ncbi:TatD family hydrolase, partial [bacterium]|nr:TatD family hydrolase [bacterium]
MIDTHCHLDVPPLGDDPAGVIERAAARGVTQIILPAYDRASWPGIVAMATNFVQVHPALGLHPWVAFEEKSENSHTCAGSGIKDQLAAAIDAAPMKIVAIGEIGLDTKVSLTEGYAELPSQLPVLAAQLELAIDLDLPVILHCRGAFEELLAAVAHHGGRLRGVVHAYSRGIELAERIIAAGLHLGLGGAVTRDRARVRKAVPGLPLDRIVLETDAPSIG